MIIRAILPNWAVERFPYLSKVVEGEFTQEKITELNKNNYNIYFLPNSPTASVGSKFVDGSDIDVFKFVFVDMDLKEGKYLSKDSFIEKLGEFELTPTKIVDSGNGIHAYWKVMDMDAMSYLKIQRRLVRFFDTDVAVASIYQLMRLEGTLNTKDSENLKPCVLEHYEDVTYTSEQMDNSLPLLTKEDEEYCVDHFNRTYSLASDQEQVDEKLPAKFGKLIHDSAEAKAIYIGEVEDRSKADYRLGHLMNGYGFTRAEAMSVLINSPKALERAPKHRINYAKNIVDKIGFFDAVKPAGLSSSIADILRTSGDSIKGTRFPCYDWLDNTAHGFRLGQIIGLVAGSGVGKTAVALNMFMGFVKNNPEYVHFFIPLEQPANEIADRWKTMCEGNTALHEKVHVISNYDDEGGFRHLSLGEIKEYLLQFKKDTGFKIGCVVIDHIGALKMEGKDGENQGLMDVCHEMKAFAIQTNTLLVMQSQTNRAKAGIGDLELNKDAAYGTMYFEAYCDYLVTIWQPLKRCYTNPECPTVTALKFCKIRHKKKGEDTIQEDLRYKLTFNPKNEILSPMTEIESEAFDFFYKKAKEEEKKNNNKDLVTYTTIKTPSEVGVSIKV